MSRSIRKHPIFKFAVSPRYSWKEYKQMANRFNRRRLRIALKKGDEFLPADLKLCYWDFDFAKCYLVLEADDYTMRRK